MLFYIIQRNPEQILSQKPTNISGTIQTSRSRRTAFCADNRAPALSNSHKSSFNDLNLRNAQFVCVSWCVFWSIWRSVVFADDRLIPSLYRRRSGRVNNSCRSRRNLTAALKIFRTTIPNMAVSLFKPFYVSHNGHGGIYIEYALILILRAKNAFRAPRLYTYIRCAFYGMYT